MFANNQLPTATSAEMPATCFALPNNIEDLITMAESEEPDDVWMKYMATLPVTITMEELIAEKSLFTAAIIEYLAE
ncbi:MAG: hypothetical protein ACRC9V_07720 [Aeromonas sp.]